MRAYGFVKPTYLAVQRTYRAAKRMYGANPLHLLVLVGCFALAAYSVSWVLEDPSLTRMLVWFVGAIIGHDLVVFPAYALADRGLTAGFGVVRRRATRIVSPVNYVRLPVLGSGLLFLLFFPGIVEQGKLTYLAATGQTQEPFSRRWLLLCAAMFAVSAVAYALRVAAASWPGTGVLVGRLKTRIGAAIARRGPDDGQ